MDIQITYTHSHICTCVDTHTLIHIHTHIITQLYHTQVIGTMVQIEHMKDEYDEMVTNLLGWIEEKIVHLSDHNFPNTLTGMQLLTTEFKDYRTIEKPLK